MQTLLQSILPFIFILVALVVIHELGHFFTAKLAGVKVLEFGVGYPPRIWGKKFGETEYTVNWLPLGGFVRLLGEEDPTDPRSLAAQPRWVRIVVMAAGAAMNAVLPIFLFAVSFMIPQDVPVGRAVVSSVRPNSPAAEAGVQAGDILLKINGRDVENYADAGYYIRLNQGRTMTWQVRRPPNSSAPGGSAGGPRILNLQVYARWAPPRYVDPQGSTQQEGPTGISLTTLVGAVPCSGNMLDGETEEQYAQRCQNARTIPTEKRSYPIWEAIPKGVVRTAETFILARNQIISWVAARSAPEVQGPVGIAQVTGQVVEQEGWVKLFELAALISINLAVINILPLPMLDGGRILFVIIEILRGGKRVPPEKEAIVHLVGFVAMISLAVVITFFDIQRIVSGESPFR